MVAVGAFVVVARHGAGSASGGGAASATVVSATATAATATAAAAGSASAAGVAAATATESGTAASRRARERGTRRARACGIRRGERPGSAGERRERGSATWSDPWWLKCLKSSNCTPGREACQPALLPLDKKGLLAAWTLARAYRPG